jgi:hypothetical protein
MINSSLEWSTRRDELQSKIRSLPYNRDLHKMLSNIDGMVTILSGAEVKNRSRGKDSQNLNELKTVNEAIDHLEKWIIYGSLIS